MELRFEPRRLDSSVWDVKHRIRSYHLLHRVARRLSSEVVGIWQDRPRTEGEWTKNVFAKTVAWFLNATLPSFLFPPLSPAVSTAQGRGLKVACVSAAVSDESVAGDSGVYEASVQRWVPGSQISANSESAQFGPLRCVLGTHRRTCPGDMSLLWQPCSELCQKQTTQFLLGLGALPMWACACSLVASKGHEARGASTGKTAAPSGEGSRATMGREGLDPA